MEQVCHKCPWWLQVRGLNRNTGVEVDNWGCAVGFLPMLLIANASQTRGPAPATEDARNRIVDVFEGMTQSLVAIAAQPANSIRAFTPVSAGSAVNVLMAGQSARVNAPANADGG